MPLHFGEMLVSRRREMGMSIQQASNITKIRPQIIEYFETENFQALPSRGYAQGIVSSYARFLGLDPNEVVNAYFDALEDYELHGPQPSRGRFREFSPEANLRSAQVPSRYHLMDTGHSGSRYAQRPPQAGYVTESNSQHEPLSTSRLRPLSAVDNRRPSQRGGDPARRNRGDRASQQRRYERDPYVGEGHPSSARPRDGRSYGARSNSPSGPMGRRSQDPRRGNIRSSGSRGGGVPPRSRGGRGASARGGRGSSGTNVPMNPRILVLVAIVALALVAFIAMTLLRGCAPHDQSPAGSAATSVQKVDKKSDDTPSKDDDSSDSDDAQSKDDDSSGSDKQAATEPEETIVKIRVKEEGVVAWIEVKLDGKSVLAKQVVGPFEQEFTVEQQIDITTDTPNEVTVYKNGKKVRYDTKVSGVAKVSISVPKVETVDLTVDTDGDGIADMTAEDAREAGYDVESRTVATITMPLSEYESAKVDSDSSE